MRPVTETIRSTSWDGAHRACFTYVCPILWGALYDELGGRVLDATRAVRRMGRMRP